MNASRFERRPRSAWSRALGLLASMVLLATAPGVVSAADESSGDAAGVGERDGATPRSGPATDAGSASGSESASSSEMSQVLERLRQLESELRQTQSELHESQERERERDARLTATEDELDAARREVDSQVEILEEHGLVEGGESSIRSSVGGFLEQVDISGWIASSYNWNFNRNGNDGQVGQNSYLLYPNSNSFQLDQAWLVVDRTPTEDSRVGFHVDMFAGRQSEFLDLLTGSDEFSLYTAYASYLMPLFEGVRIDIGRLAAATGYETVEAWHNTHITRGLTWQFQPITNTGVRMSAELPGGFSAVLGVVNDALSRSLTGSSNNSDVELNSFKTLTAGVGWADEMFSVAVTGFYGQESVLEPTDSTPAESGLIDLLILIDPNERLSLFVNSNAFLHPDVKRVGRYISTALGGRYLVLDDLGLAVRGEWARTEGPNFALDDDVDVWSITGTGDYSITKDFIAKLELRYDRADDSAFFDSGGRLDGNEDQDQLVVLVQALLGF